MESDEENEGVRKKRAKKLPTRIYDSSPDEDEELEKLPRPPPVKRNLNSNSFKHLKNGMLIFFFYIEIH